MAAHPSTLAWRIPGAAEPGGLQSMGSLQVRHDWATSLSHIGEGIGNPLQCSCLENPRDGGAWWAAVYGVAQSRTRLKRLSSGSGSSAIWALCQLVLTCVWCGWSFVSTDCYLGTFAHWFWPLSAVAGRWWALSVIWAFCQLVLTSAIEGRLGDGFVWNSTGRPRRELMTDLSFGMRACIPFRWLVLLLPYVKWEIQVQFIKKNVSCKIMTKEWFFFFLDNVWQQYSSGSREDWLRWNSWNSKKPVLFAYAVTEI